MRRNQTAKYRQVNESITYMQIPTNQSQITFNKSLQKKEIENCEIKIDFQNE